MKIFRFIRSNILFLLTLFLLAFIPLYPKLPIINIHNTWVYVRLEDFVVMFSVAVWILLLLRKKVTLKTPLTIPILIYWVIGGITTLHGVMVFFPTLSNVFSNVAFLSYLRRIEYISLFFVAYFSIKDKKFISYASIVLAITLLLIVGYGFGQRLFGFPAFLTGNEQFAKGIPLTISSLGRIPSTFGGQYDLAAYLVLVIPILVSLAFGFKNWLMKIFLLGASALGFALLFLTVSRVSFIVLLVSLVALLIAQKKKLIIISLAILTVIFLILSPSLLKRFQSTISESTVLVNTKTGAAIGGVREVPASYFATKTVLTEVIDPKFGTPSAVIVPLYAIPPVANLYVEPNSSTGESLPQGTSYVNLSLSPVIRKLNKYFFEKSYAPGTHAQVQQISGDFVVKKTKAYDLSFTTRFQGEWPNTLLAFERNIFIGSGYGSVSLAVDNDYLRFLGESGIFGFISFVSIFIIFGIYAKKILPKVKSSVVRTFVMGFAAGTLGLALNGVLIDVFEASKVAFSYWLLIGITLGALKLYEDEEINFLKEFKKVVTSTYAIVIYLLVSTFALFSSSLGYYFVGDDYTWLRWAADCTNCKIAPTILSYFTQASGFFYRPGTKMYFDLMYSAFWLNQTVYHLVTLILHFLVAVLIFFVSRKILKNFPLSVATAFVFLILSGYSESIFWISAVGMPFNAVFALLALLFFIFWKEKNKIIYLILSSLFIFISALFHELGVVVPFLLIAYDIVFCEKINFRALSKKAYYLVLLFPVFPYLALRFMSGSHWSGGDYNYNIIKLPFNLIGNTLGYLALALVGPSSLPIYDKIRTLLKDHIAISVVGSVVLLFFLVICCKKLINKLKKDEKKVVLFGFLFFIIALLPFLGLGNIAPRYVYLASFGFALIFVLLLKKIYEYLLDNGKNIAVLIMVIISIIFVSAQLFQSQKIQSDWNDAGQKTQNTLISLDYIYAHYSTEDAANLYFINVPIRDGDAWVFPVGLSDAVWLVFRTNDIKVHQVSSVKQAFDMLGTSPGKVFEFDSSDNLFQWVKTKQGNIVKTTLIEQ